MTSDTRGQADQRTGRGIEFQLSPDFGSNDILISLVKVLPAEAFSHASLSLTM